LKYHLSPFTENSSKLRGLGSIPHVDEVQVWNTNVTATKIDACALYATCGNIS
jgi:hypothetical protein